MSKDKTAKLYINITNTCNVACPFCCMKSSPASGTFMLFDTYYKLLGSSRPNCIVQLEGGEPTLHPNLFLFIEYAMSLDNVVEVVLDTNGAYLADIIDKLVEIAERRKKLLTIKPSLNNFLLKKDQQLVAKYRNIISACEFLEYICFDVNVRGYTQEELDDLVVALGNNIKYNAHLFNSYGRLAGTALPPLQLVDLYDWSCVASDGTEFGHDLVARANYEAGLL